MLIDVVSKPCAVQGHRTSDFAACTLGCKQDPVLAAVRLEEARVIVCRLCPGRILVTGVDDLIEFVGPV